MRFLNKSSSLTGIRWRPLATIALLVLMVVGCSSDSPTAPQPNPQPPPPGGGTTAFNVSVTANPTSIAVGSETPILVTVTVRRADNGAAPGNNTSMLVSTTLGNFQSAGFGPQSTNVTLFNGSAQLTLFPGAAPGTARIQAQLQNSIGTASAVFSEVLVDTFFLQSISPTSGSPEGGSRVRINGGAFLEPVRVFIGGQVAEVVNVTPTVITVRTPQITLPVGSTQAADVSVTIALNTADEETDSLPGVFTYRRDGGGAVQPQIFSVSPGSGPNEGGTQVTLQGEGFVSPVQVFFGNGAANAFNGVEAEVRSVSSNQILVVAPTATGFGQDNRDSNVSILVRNLNDGATALQPNAFAYGTDVLITALNPTLVSYEGGARVTVSGQGFDEPVAVSAGGVGQTPISVTGTEIIFRASAVAIEDCQPVTGTGADATGPVAVTNIETGAGATGPEFSYFGPNPPFITSVVPGVIEQSGGTTITLTGGNFEAPLQVTINGALTNVGSVSATQVTLSSPNIADANFNTVECDDNADGTAGTRNIPTSNNLDFSLVNINTGCAADDVQVAFTVNPVDTSCQNDVGDPQTVDPPTAAFNFSINGNQVAFSDQSLGSPTSFAWQFGDLTNATSNQQNPTFTYPGPGSYTVRLTVTNAGGLSSITATVVIP